MNNASASKLKMQKQSKLRNYAILQNAKELLIAFEELLLYFFYLRRVTIHSKLRKIVNLWHIK